MGLDIAIIGDVPTTLPMSGPQRTTKGIAESLSNKGHQVTVANYSGDPDLLNCELRVFDNDIGSHHLSMLKYQHDVQNWLKDSNFDLIHWWRAFVPWPDIRIRPDVISFHGVGVTHRVQDHLKAKAALAVTAGEKVIGSRSAYSVVQSTKTKTDAERFGADINEVIPVGIEEHFLQDDQRVPGRVLYVSRINDKKNQKELIEASRGTNWDLRLIGPIADEEYAQEIPDLEEYHVGKVSEDELLAEYAKADLFVLPSKHEGFGLTGLEAMAAETPVVASNETGLTDIIEDGENGLIYTLGDTVDLKSKIEEGLETRNLLSSKAKDTAEDLTWDRIAEKYLDIYQRVR